MGLRNNTETTTSNQPVYLKKRDPNVFNGPVKMFGNCQRSSLTGQSKCSKSAKSKTETPASTQPVNNYKVTVGKKEGQPSLTYIYTKICFSTLAGLEPAIPRFEVRCLIHLATGPQLFIFVVSSLLVTVYNAI